MFSSGVFCLLDRELDLGVMAVVSWSRAANGLDSAEDVGAGGIAAGSRTDGRNTDCTASRSFCSARLNRSSRSLTIQK